MSEEYWPHTFAPHGEQKKVAEEQVDDKGSLTIPVFEQEMICTHCKVTYIRNKQPQPAGPCPARTTDKEMKRILSQ